MSASGPATALVAYYLRVLDVYLTPSSPKGSVACSVRFSQVAHQHECLSKGVQCGGLRRTASVRSRRMAPTPPGGWEAGILIGLGVERSRRVVACFGGRLPLSPVG